MMQWMPTVLSVLALGAATGADPFQEPREREQPAVESATVAGAPDAESVVRAYKLAHSNAQYVAGKLQSLFDDVQITVDEDTNRLFLNGPESHHRKVAPVIKELDQPRERTASVVVKAAEVAKSVQESKSPGTVVAGDKIARPPAMPGGMDGLLRIFRLKHADGNEVTGLLRSLMPSGRVTSDARTNSIIVVGTPANHAEIERIIESLDVPVDGKARIFQPQPEQQRESANLRAMAERLDQQARMLAEQAAKMDASRAGMHVEAQVRDAAQLKEAVSRAYDAKMQMYEHELRQLRERVQRLEEAIHRQSAERDRAVNRRVEELLAERRAVEDARRRGNFNPPNPPEPPGRPDSLPGRELRRSGRGDETPPPLRPEPPRPPQPPDAPDFSPSDRRPPHHPEDAATLPPVDAGRRDAAKAKKAGPSRPLERPGKPREQAPAGNPPPKDGPPPPPPKDDVI